MKLSITKGLGEGEATEITQEFIASVRFRKHFCSLLRERANAHRGTSIGLSAYDNPNWALKQADLIGYERAISEVISLLSSEKV